MKVASVLLLASLFLASCSSADQPAPETSAPAPAPADPLGAMKVPDDNPITPEKVALGKQLFFDKRLSKSGLMVMPLARASVFDRR